MLVDDRQRTVYAVAHEHRDDPHALALALSQGAKCPACDGAVFGRRPSTKVWHWVHKVGSPDCPGSASESEWHLRMKRALQAGGYALEVYDRKLALRFDAVATKESHDFKIVEVVNSFSESYSIKAFVINSAFGSPPTLWIFNEASIRSTTGRVLPRFANLMTRLTYEHHTVWVYGSKLWQWDGNGDILQHPLHARILAEFEGVSLREAEANVTARVRAQAYARKKAAEEKAAAKEKRAAENVMIDPYKRMFAKWKHNRAF